MNPTTISISRLLSIYYSTQQHKTNEKKKRLFEVTVTSISKYMKKVYMKKDPNTSIIFTIVLSICYGTQQKASRSIHNRQNA